MIRSPPDRHYLGYHVASSLRILWQLHSTSQRMVVLIHNRPEKDILLPMKRLASGRYQITVHGQSDTADAVSTTVVLHMHVPHVDKMQTSLYTLIDWQRRDPSTHPYPRIRVDDALPRLLFSPRV